MLPPDCRDGRRQVGPGRELASVWRHVPQGPTGPWLSLAMDTFVNVPTGNESTAGTLPPNTQRLVLRQVHMTSAKTQEVRHMPRTRQLLVASATQSVLCVCSRTARTLKTGPSSRAGNWLIRLPFRQGLH